MSASYLTSAQLADAVDRARDGRPDKAAMSNAERRAAGLMDRRQAAEHEHLRVLPHARLAERVRGPVPDDPWVTPDLAALGCAWNAAEAHALADPADDFALCAAVAAGYRLAAALGHGDCGGVFYDPVTPLTCACGTVIGRREAVTA